MLGDIVNDREALNMLKYALINMQTELTCAAQIKLQRLPCGAAIIATNNPYMASPLQNQSDKKMLDLFDKMNGLEPTKKKWYTTNPN